MIQFIFAFYANCVCIINEFRFVYICQIVCTYFAVFTSDCLRHKLRACLVCRNAHALSTRKRKVRTDRGKKRTQSVAYISQCNYVSNCFRIHSMCEFRRHNQSSVWFHAKLFLENFDTWLSYLRIDQCMTTYSHTINVFAVCVVMRKK